MKPRFLTSLGLSAVNALALVMLFVGLASAQKKVYIPSFITREGMDLNSASSQWSYSRSVQTDNWIIFWEAGFGSNPSTASGSYKVDMDVLKAVAEKSFATYVNDLKMVIKGSSAVDTVKQMIFLLYTTEWGAYGSGQDDKVGVLHVNPAAANINTVVAHEIGHCFEYLTGVDVPGGGYRYGFGANASGSNGFWEQVANWQAFKVYPERQFTEGDFQEYIKSNHMHIIHETPRYANYFLPDFWTYKRGLDFIGKLWRNARKPEDPVETYKRLNSLTQEQFNDEMYDHAARLTTWDLPALKTLGANYITRRAQVKMSLTSDKYWLVDPSVAIENYGYNSIKLNAPATQTIVTVSFKGKAGASGFRSLKIDKGGWRYGFVALLKDGTRAYSDMGTAKYANGANPEGALQFTVPANCDKLWFVVSGSPQEYWRHAWDDDDSNDEQWPYQVQFGNTNLLGEVNNPGTPLTTYTLSSSVVGSGTVSPASGSFVSGSVQTLTATPASGFVFTGWSGDASGNTNPLSLTMSGNKTVVATFVASPAKVLTYTVVMSPKADYTATPVAIQVDTIAKFFNLTSAQITAGLGSTITYYAINPDGTLDATSTANDPGHWFGKTGNVVAYGEQAYVYSELDLSKFVANIGQYPDRSQNGDSYTIKQALVYKKSATESAQVTLVFQVQIGTTTTVRNVALGNHNGIRIHDGMLQLEEQGARLEMMDLHGRWTLLSDQTAMNALPRGVLFLRITSGKSKQPVPFSIVNP